MAEELPETEAERESRGINSRLSSLNFWYGIGCLVGMGVLTPQEAIDEYDDPPTQAARSQKYMGILFQRDYNNG